MTDSSSLDRRKTKHVPPRGQKVLPGRRAARIRMDETLWARYAEVVKAQGHPDRSEAIRRFIQCEVDAYDKAQRNEGSLFDTEGEPN
jgi:hypothetical protein